MVCVNDSQPMMRYLQKSQPEMSGSLGERGGLDMMSRSGGLKPRAVAGKPSVTRLTHSNWTGIRASGIPKAAVRKILRDREKNTMLKMLMLQTKSSHFNGNLCNWNLRQEDVVLEKNMRWEDFFFVCSLRLETLCSFGNVISCEGGQQHLAITAMTVAT